VSLIGADAEGVAGGTNGGAWGRGAVGAQVERVESSARIETLKAPRGVGSGQRPPQNFFRFSSSKRRVLVHSGTDKRTFD